MSIFNELLKINAEMSTKINFRFIYATLHSGCLTTYLKIFWLEVAKTPAAGK